MIFTFFSSSIFAQSNSFTGKILYEYSFQKPDTKEDITDRLAPELGYEQHYFINSKNYKAYDENGNFVQSYNSETNKYYFLDPLTDQIMVINGSIKTSQNVKVTYLDDIEVIMGKKCKKLIVKTERQETIYYYSEEIRVNPEPFLNHHFGDWSYYMEASNGALPLKYVVENEQYTWISTAKEIEEMKLSYKDFDPDIIFE
ncbi:hypothetical protein [Gracilimonas sp.]|uniref:hypothetical protein n=1 Tax=Gracilimonas sp. TaxID=1974203 RepID=UPI0032EB7390